MKEIESWRLLEVENLSDDGKHASEGGRNMAVNAPSGLSPNKSRVHPAATVNKPKVHKALGNLFRLVVLVLHQRNLHW